MKILLFSKKTKGVRGFPLENKKLAIEMNRDTEIKLKDNHELSHRLALSYESH